MDLTGHRIYPFFNWKYVADWVNKRILLLFFSTNFPFHPKRRHTCFQDPIHSHSKKSGNFHLCEISVERNHDTDRRYWVHDGTYRFGGTSTGGVRSHHKTRHSGRGLIKDLKEVRTHEYRFVGSLDTHTWNTDKSAPILFYYNGSYIGHTHRDTSLRMTGTRKYRQHDMYLNVRTYFVLHIHRKIDTWILLHMKRDTYNSNLVTPMYIL